MTASKNIKMEAAYRAMVDRFLGWKLPQDFGPDAGISFTPPPHLPDLYWPTGTNLFHAGQALEMFKHCVELPSAAAVRLAEKNLFDAQEAAKTIAKQAIAAEAERDTLAAKLAELEGQEPVAWMTAKRDMASFVNFHDDDLPLYARPVPAGRPVNARLLSALIQCRDRFVFYVGHHLDKGDMGKAAENEKFVAMANDAIASAESAPKAGRLTDRECAMATSESAHMRSDDMLRIARAIETAVLRKNGIEVAE